MRWTSFWTSALFATVATDTLAHPNDLDLQHFRPAIDAEGFVTVDGSKVLNTLDPALGFYLNYAWNSLDQKIGGEERHLIENFGEANLVLALGFFEWFELGADMPVVIARGDAVGDEEPLSSDGFGDLRLSLKLRILSPKYYPVGVAVMGTVQLPTGTSGMFATSGKVEFLPKLIVDAALGERVKLGANVGMHLRDKQSLNRPIVLSDGSSLLRSDPVTLVNSVAYGLGGSVALIKDHLQLLAEVFGEVPIEKAERGTPIETLLALRMSLSEDAFFNLGISRGWRDQAGEPELRVLGGIIFQPEDNDRDGDGIPNSRDRCPDEAEDFDQFEDEDGCPDPDNDFDGIPDAFDQCPNSPEDMNGYQDNDGCPDGEVDSDGDGIPDSLDKCPNEPEDFDGFADKDGCPDLDNDGDGIPDSQDQCPNEKETFNDFEDEDGCPDEVEAPSNVVVSDNRIDIIEKVFFETNKAKILPESFPILDEIARVLQRNQQITLLEIQGHTDKRGKAAKNLELSKKRAAAVREYLIEQGVAADRLISEGYGSTQPVDPRDVPEAWEKNRRVDFVILETSN